MAINQTLKPTRTGKISLIVFGSLSMGLWMHSMLVCRVPLQTNHDQRTTAMKAYIESGDPKQLNSWNAEQAKEVLEKSQEIGLYDYTNAVSQ